MRKKSEIIKNQEKIKPRNSQEDSEKNNNFEMKKKEKSNNFF